MPHAQFDRLIAGDKPVLVEFYADWCEPCKWLDPILTELDQLNAGKASTLKVDIEQFPELKNQYHVLSVPVLIIFKKGKVMWRMNGFTYAKELNAKLLEFI